MGVMQAKKRLNMGLQKFIVSSAEKGAVHHIRFILIKPGNNHQHLGSLIYKIANISYVVNGYGAEDKRQMG